MEVSRISQQSIEIYSKNLAKQADIRHEQRILEERRNKENSTIAEQKRIEMNRQMNRSGQNVDKLA
jgi:hypothetical protein